MADPVVAPTTAATLVAAAAAAPVLTIFGIPLGLQADELVAGLFGAVTAIVLLDTVPSTGDTIRELVRTTTKRVGVAAVSALMAGYAAPVAGVILLGLLGTVLAPERASDLEKPFELLCAFVVGGGAQRLFKAVIDMAARRVAGGAKPEGS